MLHLSTIQRFNLLTVLSCAVPLEHSFTILVSNITSLSCLIPSNLMVSVNGNGISMKLGI